MNELVNMLDSEIFADPELFGEEVYKLRVRKEEETGIPMEEDTFGRQEAELKRSLGISFDQANAYARAKLSPVMSNSHVA